MLHKRFGKLPWPDVLDARGRSGRLWAFRVSPGLASATVAHRGLLEKDPGAAALFLQGRAASNPARCSGSLLSRQRFGRSPTAAQKRSIAASAAAALGRYVQSPRRRTRRKRLRRLRAADGSSRCELSYRGLDVRVMPPNSYGVYMLLQLAALADADFSGLGATAPERYAALIAAAKSAFAAGDKSVADPAVVGRWRSIGLSQAGIEELRRDFRERLGRTASNRGGTSVIADGRRARQCRGDRPERVPGLRLRRGRSRDWHPDERPHARLYPGKRPPEHGRSREAAGPHAQPGHDLRQERRFATCC